MKNWKVTVKYWNREKPLMVVDFDTIAEAEDFMDHVDSLTAGDDITKIELESISN